MKLAGWIVAGVLVLILSVVLTRGPSKREPEPALPTFTLSPSPQVIAVFDEERCNAVGGTWVQPSFGSGECLSNL